MSSLPLPDTPQPLTEKYDWDTPSFPLKDKYERLILVSHPRHVKNISPDGDSLIVSCDWLLWKRMESTGHHCIHYEWEWNFPPDDDLNRHLYSRSIDWVFIEAEDVTAFRGVSLGQLLVRSVSRVIREYEKLDRSLDALLSRFRPKDVILYDYRDAICYLDESERRKIVSDNCNQFGALFIDRFDPPTDGDREMAPNPVPRTIWRTPQPFLTRLIRDVFSVTVSGVSRLRNFFQDSRPGVLMLSTHLSTIPLIRAYEGRGVRPFFLARTFPRKKDLRFLMAALKKGVQLVFLKTPQLDNGDRQAVDRIGKRLSAAWKGDKTEGAQKAVQNYVRRHVLEAGWLLDLGAEVVWAERLLDRIRPHVVFADGWESITGQILFSAAHNRGIQTVMTWHGPWVNDQKLPILGCDSRMKSSITTCFTWGRSHEGWLEATGARVEKKRTGNVICNEFLSRRKRTGHRSRKHRRVLVLEYATCYDDLSQPLACQFSFLVETVRMLKEQGVEEVHVKLHPGGDRLSYYLKIAAAMNLDCSIFQDGPFGDFLDWADLVVGPVHSGAMLEVLASGKPYFPVLLRPHAVNEAHLKNGSIFEDVDSLAKALKEPEPPAQDGLLKDFTALDSIPDPARIIWQSLEEMAAQPSLHP